MSKTYRKVVAFTDYSRIYTPWSKRQASKAARKDWNIDDGNAYRKVYNTWNIRDFRFCYYTASEVESYYEPYQVPLKESSLWTYRTYETIRKMT